MTPTANDNEDVPRPKKRPRRASSPPTKATVPGESDTPDADWGEWLKPDKDADNSKLNARDKWFYEQRPPHWG